MVSCLRDDPPVSARKLPANSKYIKITLLDFDCAAKLATNGNLLVAVSEASTYVSPNIHDSRGVAMSRPDSRPGFQVRTSIILFFFSLTALNALAQKAESNGVKYSLDYKWSETPSDDLNQPGPKTVNLASCPLGVKGETNLSIGSTLRTGTMRKRSKLLGAAALEMLPRDPCSSQLPSACGRIHCGQCIQWVAGGAIAARFVPGNPAGLAQSGRVMVSVGEFDAYARVSIRSSNITVDFSGSIADCWMDDTCIYVGDPTSSTRYLDVNVIGPRGRPMVVGGQHPFLEVNATNVSVQHVHAVGCERRIFQ